MSNEYAIEVLKETLHFYETECSPEKMCSSAWLGVVKKMSALRLAIDAMKRQVALEPCLSGDGYADGKMVYDIWECPNCGAEYEISEGTEVNYCPECGQHLLWEE